MIRDTCYEWAHIEELLIKVVPLDSEQTQSSLPAVIVGDGVYAVEDVLDLDHLLESAIE